MQLAPPRRPVTLLCVMTEPPTATPDSAALHILCFSPLLHSLVEASGVTNSYLAFADLSSSFWSEFHLREKVPSASSFLFIEVSFFTLSAGFQRTPQIFPGHRGPTFLLVFFTLLHFRVWMAALRGAFCLHHLGAWPTYFLFNSYLLLKSCQCRAVLSRTVASGHTQRWSTDDVASRD